MARTISTTTVQHQTPDAAGFALDVAAAEARALMTGESVAQVLDRMDAADPYTLTATNPILSGTTEALSLGRNRSHLVIDRRGVLCHEVEVPAGTVAHELSVVHTATGPAPLAA
ncbi:MULTISPECIES: hypothetical protein [unclassified Isoptericola]|uniref:hypothetical protein n=1 Tax=Isoptericola sp. NPDC056134 TaxID=3345723 RepID=UPI0035EEBE09